MFALNEQEQQEEHLALRLTVGPLRNSLMKMSVEVDIDV